MSTPGTPPPEAAPEPVSPQAPKLPQKKTHLWMLTIVTYSLVILMTIASIWAYYYMDAKVRRERGAPPRGSVPELMPKRKF